MIKAVRISKTSFKPWALYGPIDQALKTSIQAESVRVRSVTAPIGDEQVELELWIDAADTALEELEAGNNHAPNVPATAILLIAHARANGLPLIATDGNGVLLQAEGMELVYGPAIMTGAGGTDVPEAHLQCLMDVLLGIGG